MKTKYLSKKQLIVAVSWRLVALPILLTPVPRYKRLQDLHNQQPVLPVPALGLPVGQPPPKRHARRLHCRRQVGPPLLISGRFCLGSLFLRGSCPLPPPGTLEAAEALKLMSGDLNPSDAQWTLFTSEHALGQPADDRAGQQHCRLRLLGSHVGIFAAPVAVVLRLP